MEHPILSARNYVRSHAYETYIRFARSCERDQFGAHNAYMNNLLDLEQGKNYVHKSIEDVKAQVKKYMLAATKAALKRKITAEDRRIAITYLTRIIEAEKSEDLLAICDEGIELFRKYEFPTQQS